MNSFQNIYPPENLRYQKLHKKLPYFLKSKFTTGFPRPIILGPSSTRGLRSSSVPPGRVSWEKKTLADPGDAGVLREQNITVNGVLFHIFVPKKTKKGKGKIYTHDQTNFSCFEEKYVAKSKIDFWGLHLKTSEKTSCVLFCFPLVLAHIDPQELVTNFQQNAQKNLWFQNLLNSRIGTTAR